MIFVIEVIDVIEGPNDSVRPERMMSGPYPDVDQVFALAEQLRDSARAEGRQARLRLRLERKMFPFIPHAREIALESMAILFEAHQDDEDYVELTGCPCPEPGHRATRWIEIRRCDNERGDAEKLLCHANEEWPDPYCSVFNAKAVLGGRRHHAEYDVGFGDEACELGAGFLLCRYRTESCAGPGPDPFHDRLGHTVQLDRSIQRPAFLVAHAEDT
jgi:hypothetical protein